MAWIKSLIGVGQTYETLTAWETAIQGLVAGDYEAEILSDIEDDVAFASFAVGQPKRIWIHGDLTGAIKRRITVPPSGTTVININTDEITDLTVEDLVLDGTNQTSGTTRVGLRIALGCATITVNRVHAVHMQGDGFRTLNTSSNTVLNITNCIAEDCTNGVLVSKLGSTVTLINTGLYKNRVNGTNATNDATITRAFHNCVAMGNAGNGFNAIVLSTTNLINCVSDDASATAAGHTSTTNCVADETDYTSYFTDYAGDDFTLKDSSANLSWGVSNDVNAPIDDLVSYTRVAGDIGPYEYQIPVPTFNPLAIFLGA